MSSIKKFTQIELEFLNYIKPHAYGDFSGYKITKYKKLFYLIKDETNVDSDAIFLRFNDKGIMIFDDNKIASKVFKRVVNELLNVISDKFNNLKSKKNYEEFIAFCRLDENLKNKIKLCRK
jgi:hypothetical protein